MKSVSPITGVLIEVLALLAPESSKNTLRCWIEHGRVSIDGEVVKSAKHPVKEGQQVILASKTVFLEEGIEILYEDRDLVVLEKPAGLLSVALDSGNEPSIHALLKKRFHRQRVYPVHRLDRDTSGVMMFAYSEIARDRLKKTFAAHNILRIYIAIVEGHLTGSGTWQNYLAEDKNCRVYPTDDPEKGVLAITHFEAIGHTKNYTAIRLRLETGRKNQIRVQCQCAGYPVLGDEKYGGSSSKRLFLHAQLLELMHPTKNRKFSFHSPLPPLFRKVIDIK